MAATRSQNEVYISIDVETAGPNPHDYSLLSIGACVVADLGQTFYIELQPVNSQFTTGALEISGLSLQRLEEHGVHPKEALSQFEAWVRAQTARGGAPIFVAFNAAFDWMFINDYFHRYLGRNPFGHTALDIKSFYMGLYGVRWAETSMHFVGPRYLGNEGLTHNALQDAKDQALIFRKMLDEARRHS